MPTPLSAAAWSTWGWRYPNIYSPPGSATQQTTQYPTMTIQSQTGLPFQIPSTLPMDPTYLQSLVYPALMQMFKGQQDIQSKRESAGLGMDLAKQIGITEPGEPDPSTQYRLRSALADALRNVQSQTARSGMSLSSVRDRAEQELMQQFAESYTRNLLKAEQDRKNLLANFLARLIG